MSSLRSITRRVLPLSLRMRLAATLTKYPWLPLSDHVVMGLVRDLLAQDPKLFHKFAWSHHLMGYARWYDSEDELFDAERMQPSRIELFRDLADVLDRDLGVNGAAIDSILEVGCSQGYLLRHFETSMFPGSRELVGIDIDAEAVAKGARYLSGVGSRVSLLHGDMENLEALLGNATYDITLAAGVLSYLNEADAARVVTRMVQRTRKLLVFAGLASVETDNRSLPHSIPSPTHDGQWIHNFDALVRSAGGRVVRHRWEGARLYNFQTLCFAFAVPHGTSDNHHAR